MTTTDYWNYHACVACGAPTYHTHCWPCRGVQANPHPELAPSHIETAVDMIALVAGDESNGSVRDTVGALLIAYINGVHLGPPSDDQQRVSLVASFIECRALPAHLLRKMLILAAAARREYVDKVHL